MRIPFSLYCSRQGSMISWLYSCIAQVCYSFVSYNVLDQVPDFEFYSLHLYMYRADMLFLYFHFTPNENQAPLVTISFTLNNPLLNLFTTQLPMSFPSNCRFLLTGVSPQAVKVTASKSVSSILFAITDWCFKFSSYKHLLKVMATSLSSS